MPELPEVETVRRMLEAHVQGRTIRSAHLSGKKLRAHIAANLPARIRGRAITRIRRHGKYLLIDLDRGLSLLSHLGMSGRWLFFPGAQRDEMSHVHVRIGFRDGSWLWFQDPRRFGLLRMVETTRASRDPALAILGPDPIADPPTGERLHRLAHGRRVNVKSFLLDQRRLAGIGNIYASEILHRAEVDPRRRAGAIGGDEWGSIAAETLAVLGEAIDRMGTTFSSYRTLWNQPGDYADKLMVYDRAGEPCLRCGTEIRRIVQGQRSTFFCPACQSRKPPTPSRKKRQEIRTGP